MKLITFILCNLIIVGIFSGCSKKESDADNNLYLVKFKATGLSQSIKDYDYITKVANINSDLPKSSKMISHLHFVIFDSQGMVVQTITQDTAKTINFGSAEIHLPIGKYRIAVVGASNYDSSFGEYSILAEDLTSFRIRFKVNAQYNSIGIKSTFCSELVAFEVNGNGLIEKELLIKRISSQLDIVFDNMFPKNLGSLVVEIPSVNEYNFFGQNRENFYLSYYVDLRDIVGKTGGKLSIPIFAGVDGKNSPKVLKMTFSDGMGILVRKSVENIKFEKNKITQVKGNLSIDANPVSVNVGSEFDGKINFTF